MKLNQEIEQRTAHERDLFQAISQLQSLDEIKAFFQDLCTPAELQAMADRWHVVDYIQKGVPYREIYEKTGISVTTVGRVARCLQLGNGGYLTVYERIYSQSNKSPQNCDPKKR